METNRPSSIWPYGPKVLARAGRAGKPDLRRDGGWDAADPQEDEPLWHKLKLVLRLPHHNRLPWAIRGTACVAETIPTKLGHVPQAWWCGLSCETLSAGPEGEADLGEVLR